MYAPIFCHSFTAFSNPCRDLETVTQANAAVSFEHVPAVLTANAIVIADLPS